MTSRGTPRGTLPQCRRESWQHASRMYLLDVQHTLRALHPLIGRELTVQLHATSGPPTGPSGAMEMRGTLKGAKPSGGEDRYWFDFGSAGGFLLMGADFKYADWQHPLIQVRGSTFVLTITDESGEQVEPPLDLPLDAG